jgi:Flp pilus assembly protein TadG
MIWRRSSDDGAAMIEFVILAVALAVPLSYLLLAVFDVQRAAYGATSATREAARVFVRAPSTTEAEVRARAAAGVSLADHGVLLSDGDLEVSCSASPCLTPGARVSFTYRVQVPLPLVPVIGDRALVSVPVTATHTQTVDAYAPVRP